MKKKESIMDKVLKKLEEIKKKKEKGIVSVDATEKVPYIPVKTNPHHLHHQHKCCGHHFNYLNRILDWNIKRKTYKQGSNPKRTITFVMEEMMESLMTNEDYDLSVKSDKDLTKEQLERRKAIKDRIKKYAQKVAEDAIKWAEKNLDYSESKEDTTNSSYVKKKLDSYGDAAFFLGGEMLKDCYEAIVALENTIKNVYHTEGKSESVIESDLRGIINRAMKEIADNNDAKGCKTDENGKIIKSDSHKGPNL